MLMLNLIYLAVNVKPYIFGDRVFWFSYNKQLIILDILLASTKASVLNKAAPTTYSSS